MVLIDMDVPKACCDCRFAIQHDRNECSSHLPDEGRYFFTCAADQDLDITVEEIGKPYPYRHEKCPLKGITIEERELPIYSCDDCKKRDMCKGRMKPWFKHACNGFVNK